MALSRLLGCNVYISEGRNVQLIRRLEELCQRVPRVALANTFVDAPYNRTGLTLVATNSAELTAAVLAVAEAALSALDLRSHAADHPRLGVLDHVSLHPLGQQATLQQAADAATSLGQQLAAAPFGLPVYYYGAAHRAGRRLAEIRRQLGYFKANSSSSSGSSGCGCKSSSKPADWAGSLPEQQLSHYPPDAGPSSAPPAAGVVTLGAVPWVVNFNVPLFTADRAAAAAVARAVSTRGGGLKGVEAMALQHGPGVIEVATNLIGMDWTTGSSSSHISSSSDSSRGSADPQTAAAARGAGAEQVMAAIAAAAAQHGMPPPGPGYVTNKLPAELLEAARKAGLQ
ncbi:hypothetical protein OEZ85_012531 [Tetradesmus obliquus]|uniref:Formiminotransferase N-terminal subdomain domain-containing protein n=1 Tax=Tetradesmus obliquus TaxID=3088 RepID=A0ABY8TYG2_TETOB|nr:hypothetical protein OEZ85_012531 [Tetradesmus obliquus]